jgi:predicted nucleic acid-binding protein
VNPPTVLLERSFVAALVDAGSPHHRQARDCYLSLVDEFTADRRLLAITSDTRNEFARAPRGLLHPATTLHVAGQERHAARRVDGVDDADLALNLVLVRRHKIAAVATFDPRYLAYDIDVVPGFAN